MDSLCNSCFDSYTLHNKERTPNGWKKNIYIIQDGLVKYLSHYVRVHVTSTILLLAFNCGLSLYFIYLS